MEPALKKIIITLIGGLLVVGIAGSVFFWIAGPAGPSPVSTTTAPYSGSNSVNTVTTNSQTGAQGAQQPAYTAVDINGAYQTLFGSLLAVRAAWSPVVATTTGDFSKVYGLYSADTALAQGAPIHASAVDLNEDGTKDALVLEDLPGYCSSAGCPLAVYIRQKSGWQKVLDLVAVGEVGVANTFTNGYADLFIPKKTNTGPETVVVRYAWSGSEYQAVRTVAAWTGSAFKLLP